MALFLGARANEPLYRLHVSRKRLFIDVVLVEQHSVDAMLKQREMVRLADVISEMMLVIINDRLPCPYVRP